MPRKPRVKSKYNMYHIMLRGNERKDIFLDDDDIYKFIDKNSIGGGSELELLCSPIQDYIKSGEI